MFKKIIILLLIFSPLWFSLIVGYPIISEKQYQREVKENPKISVSKRCFGVGTFEQYIECFGTSDKLKGGAFVNEINQKTNQISPVFTAVLLASFAVFFIATIIFISSW